MIAYSAVYSLISALKYLSHNTFAWDLGIYNQVMWSLLTNHNFHYTVEYFINPSGNYLAQHFGPDLILLLPVYALAPSPVTLLVVQSVVISLGAYAVWLLARLRRIGPRSAAFFAFSYLVYPPVLGVNWYDFHLESFFLVGMLFAVYFWRRRRWVWFSAAALVSLLTIESAALLLAFFGILAILAHWPEVKGFLRHPRRRPVEGWLPIVIAVGSVLFFVAVRAYQRSLNPSIPPEFLGVYRAATNWSVLGIGDPLNPIDLAGALLLHPDRIVAAVFYDLPSKVLYLSFFLVPLMGLPLRKPWWLLPAFPWFVGLLLSNYPPYYTLGYQYASFLIPWFYVAAVTAYDPSSPKGFVWNGHSWALSRWPRVSGERVCQITVAYFVATILVLAAAPAFWISTGIQSQFAPGLRGGSVVPTSHDSAVQGLLDLIPPTATVVTQSNLFPPLSSRPNAYVVPYVQPVRDAWLLVASHIEGPIRFILFDNATDPLAGSFMYSYLVGGGGYGLLGVAGTARLYEYAYVGPTHVFSLTGAGLDETASFGPPRDTSSLAGVRTPLSIGDSAGLG